MRQETKTRSGFASQPIKSGLESHVKYSPNIHRHVKSEVTKFDLTRKADSLDVLGYREGGRIVTNDAFTAKSHAALDRTRANQYAFQLNLNVRRKIQQSRLNYAAKRYAETLVSSNLCAFCSQVIRVKSAILVELPKSELIELLSAYPLTVNENGETVIDISDAEFLLLIDSNLRSKYVRNTLNKRVSVFPKVSERNATIAEKFGVSLKPVYTKRGIKQRAILDKFLADSRLKLEKEYARISRQSDLEKHTNENYHYADIKPHYRVFTDSKGVSYTALIDGTRDKDGLLLQIQCDTVLDSTQSVKRPKTIYWYQAKNGEKVILHNHIVPEHYRVEFPKDQIVKCNCRKGIELRAELRNKVTR